MCLPKIQHLWKQLGIKQWLTLVSECFSPEEKRGAGLLHGDSKVQVSQCVSACGTARGVGRSTSPLAPGRMVPCDPQPHRRGVSKKLSAGGRGLGLVGGRGRRPWAAAILHASWLTPR